MTSTPLCAVDGCTRQRKYRHHCGMHHRRIAATGAPGPAQPIVTRIDGTLAERLWSRVTKTPAVSAPVTQPSGQCWTCATSRTTYMGGYATISTGRLRAALASALGGGEQQ